MFTYVTGVVPDETGCSEDPKLFRIIVDGPCIGTHLRKFIYL